jgi:hypothetical protein
MSIGYKNLKNHRKNNFIHVIHVQHLPVSFKHGKKDVRARRAATTPTRTLRI